MALELRYPRSKWWYGRVAIGERRLLKNLGVKIQGEVPAKLTQFGDPVFERTRAKAQAALENLSRAAVARLKLFDVPEEVITELTRTKEPRRTMVFRAPVDGVVIEKMGVAGQMMKPGERIYRLADLSSIWVQAEIYEKDLPFVRPGAAALIRTSYGPERTFGGKVELLLPQVQEQTRTATARIVLPSSDGFLRPGMFVDVRFTAQLDDDAVLVPDMAVLRSGEHNTVFVALDGGYFEAREVKLGARSEGNNYQVLHGLEAGERVVTSGQFMLDSESQLREAIQKMLKPTDSAVEPVAPASLATSAPKTSSANVPPASLEALAFAGADAAAPLAKDDLAGYQAQLPVLRAALTAFYAANEHAVHGPFGAFKDGLTETTDLKSARRDFASLSSAIADAVLAAHLTVETGLHVFECSMAKARWLQRDSGTKNPFYGEKMLTCGDEITESVATPKMKMTQAAPPLDANAIAGGLPPGHPPIGAAMSVADYLRAQRGIASHDPKAGAAGEGCGSCGMSAAAMAAGEPCEHDKK